MGNSRKCPTRLKRSSNQFFSLSDTNNLRVSLFNMCAQYFSVKLWNSHHVCFMSCTDNNLKNTKIIRAALHCEFYIWNIKIFVTCHLIVVEIFGDFGTEFFMTIQLVPNSFQLYSYDIHLLSLFLRQSLILSNVFHQLQRELFWGWANQAQNFFTTLLAITRLLDFEVTTLPYPTRSWKSTTRWGLVLSDEISWSTPCTCTEGK